MKLLPLNSPDIIELAASWLGRKENYQWLDIGNGSHQITPALLKIMAQRETHLIRVYTSNDNVTPIGIAALNNVDHRCRTGTLWGLAGEKSFVLRGYGTLAAARFLALAFRECGLRAINTWVVDHNPSLRIIERLGFRFIGRQRQCHLIDDRTYDRLLFDLLAEEFEAHDAYGERNRARPQRNPVRTADERPVPSPR